MDRSTAQRRLVKSPPELWAEVSDEDALGRRLAEFGEIRITRVDPETTVVVTYPWADGAEVKHEYGIELGEVSAQNPVDSLVIAVGHQEFRAMTPDTLKSYCTNDHKPVAADLKTLYDRYAMAKVGFTVFRF